ncbi:hypothetical protein F4818DRAFT_411974 [Hypoxylon cercidicola]|nr:hypothetical protein F4818DRAFT_411974 [Hypoxylon cercidicola]
MIPVFILCVCCATIRYSSGIAALGMLLSVLLPVSKLRFPYRRASRAFAYGPSSMYLVSWSRHPDGEGKYFWS